MSGKPIIALTAGDVAGIGPEIIIRALQNSQVRRVCQPLVMCHPDILRRAAELCNVKSFAVQCLDHLPDRRHELVSLLENGGETVFCFNPIGDQVLEAPVQCVSAEAGDAAYRYLTAAIKLCQSQVVDAIATAPLNKAALHAAGHNFPGHTEILAQQCGIDSFAMMLHLSETRLIAFRDLVQSPDENSASGFGVSIAHVTLHTSVQSVSEALTTDGIVDRIQLMDGFLTRIGCHRNAIAVCALNPHGGEGGLFGDEEDRIIEPAVSCAKAAGLNVCSPLPVDTLMRRAFGGEFDGIIAMYHDQGHIPVKLIGFDAAVNITLGLPIVRTSPTHGTAFDRAWSRETPADPAGMIEAILTAVTLCRKRSPDRVS